MIVPFPIPSFAMDRKKRKTATPPVNPRKKSNRPCTKVSRIFPNSAAVPNNARPITKRHRATLKESMLAAYLMRVDIPQNATLEQSINRIPLVG